jgi:hypothetical protein
MSIIVLAYVLKFKGRRRWLGVYEPSFDRDGRLVVVTDITGGRVLFIQLDDGAARPVEPLAQFLGKAALDGRVLAVGLP